MKQLLFITGTGTGAGKTVLACLLVGFLRKQGVNAAALKPVCSGGRDDARKIFSAINGALPLDVINPWHFRAPVAPILAARLENQTVQLSHVLAHVRAMRKRFEVVIVEGAGGLLSPLADDFDSRDLILGLRATPIVVAQNQLGVLNRVLLTLEALPKKFRNQARVVLMAPAKADASSATNAKLLAEFFPAKMIFSLPRIGKRPAGSLADPRVVRAIRALSHF